MSEYHEKGKKDYNILIKSVIPHKWTGNLSIFDDDFDFAFKRLDRSFQLSNSILMTPPDFFNIFSSAYVTTFKQEFP